MQPARPEPVWNRTRPASAAIAGALRGAMMSSPSCAPWPRGSPKLFVSWVRPSTGKTICLPWILGLAGFDRQPDAGVG